MNLTLKLHSHYGLDVIEQFKADIAPLYKHWLAGVLNNSNKDSSINASEIIGTNYVIEGEPVTIYMSIIVKDDQEEPQAFCFFGHKDRVRAIRDICQISDTMKVHISIKSEYDKHTEAKLITDLEPTLRSWIRAAINNSDQTLAKPVPPIYYESQILQTDCVIKGEPVAIFIFILSSSNRPPEVHCWLGPKENVRVIGAQFQTQMKDLAMEDDRASFLEIED